MLLLSVFATVLLSFTTLARVHDAEQHVLVSESARPSTVKDELDDVISSSRLLTLHRALCETESISFHEKAVGKLIINLLEAHNFTVTSQEVAPPSNVHSNETRWNIYAVPDASKFTGLTRKSKHHTPKVLLTSHIDTVPPFIPYSLSRPKSKSKPKREDIVIAGRGTVDAKACVAAQITTAMELLSDPDVKFDPADIALLFVVGEENTGDGMKHFSDSSLWHDTKEGYKAIIFGEPTEAKLATGHKGIVMLYIDAYGKAAHSGYPWLGRSANSMILPTLMALDTLEQIPEDKGGFPRSDVFSNTTVNVGLIEGGVAGNVVPAYATASIAFRLAAGSLEVNQDVIKRAIQKADPEGLLELHFTQGYGPVYLDYDVPGFDTISVNYGTDVPNLEVSKDAKRYLYGPGSILVAHGADEALTVGQLEDAVEGYKKLVRHALKL